MDWRILGLAGMVVGRMNILIVKTSAIGDVIHTLPALNCLRRAYPDARITWLVEEAASGLINGHPALDRVIVSGRKRWLAELLGRPWRVPVILGKFRDLLHKIRDTRYDLVIDFQGLLKSAILVALTRADRKVGFDRGMQHAEHSHLFYNLRVPPVDMEVHALDRGLRLLEALGISCPSVEYNLPIGQVRRERIMRLIEAAGGDPSLPLVVIHPQTTWPTKLWKMARFAEVAERLAGSGRQVVFTGSAGDRREISEELAGITESVVNLAGETGLLDLAALFQLARLVISTDTGPMHIAVAAGARLVALFGPTAPWRTGPYGDGHHIIRDDGLGCSPCFKRECRAGTCMDRITVDQVVEVVEEILADT